eukprot:5347662-Amphidinium_carterae.1
MEAKTPMPPPYPPPGVRSSAASSGTIPQGACASVVPPPPKPQKASTPVVPALPPAPEQPEQQQQQVERCKYKDLQRTYVEHKHSSDKLIKQLKKNNSALAEKVAALHKSDCKANCPPPYSSRESHAIH